MFNILKKVIFACLLGLFVTVYIAQNQEEFKNQVKSKIQELWFNSVNCKLNCEINSVNIFLPYIKLHNVFVEDKDWSWSCDEFNIYCSWLDFIFLKKFNANVEIYNYQAKSKIIDNNLAIREHINKLIFSNTGDLPFAVKNLKLEKSNIDIYDQEKNLKINLDFTGYLKDLQRESRIILYLTNGYINKDNSNYVENINSQIYLTNSKDKNIKSKIELDGLCNLANLKIADNRCYFEGKFEGEEKLLKISTIDGKLILGPINFYKDKINLIVQAPIDYVQQLLNLQNYANGDCILNLQSDYKFDKANGNLVIKNLILENFKDQSINELKLIFNKNQNKYFGNLDLEKDKNLKINSNWNLEHSQNIKLDYFAQIFSNKLEKEIKLNSKLNINLQKSNIQASGNIENHKYNLDLEFKPIIAIKNFSYFNEKNQECIKIDSQLIDRNLAKLKAIFYLDNLKNWMPVIINENAMGSGELILEGKIDQEKFNGKIFTNNLNITVPKIYNIINKFNCNIDILLKEQKIMINNLNIKMHKGQFQSDNVILIFDLYKNLLPNFVYFPIILKECFLCFKKDILGSVSGKMNFNKNSDNQSINGYLLINNAQIKNNIFSNEFRNDIFAKKDSDLKINLAIINKSPIKIKTPFLQTKTKLNLKLKNNLISPEVSGSIELNEGSIIFPYKNLNIINGNIIFDSNQPNDPIINLTAKNKIKRYNITLNVSGTLQDQIIKFESSPFLTDEQIVALLLIGSEKGSINMIMPTLFIQNIKNIISGSFATHVKIKKYFDTLLKPLKFIKLIPTFTDESARGGFRGTIEIEIIDRLRASIQKNFSLTEDEKYEVDYALTDEINLRASRDERSDIGAEVEMRWKF